MDIFVVTSRGILVEEIPDPGNSRRFGNSCISMLHSGEIICDQYPAGLTIDSFIDIFWSLSSKVIPEKEKSI